MTDVSEIRAQLDRIEAKIDQLARAVGVQPDPEAVRLAAGAPLWGNGLDWRVGLLWEADLITLEEVAGAGREDVAAISGIGQLTLEQLDAVLGEHGLEWKS
jgi:hypothetical protein